MKVLLILVASVALLAASPTATAQEDEPSVVRVLFWSGQDDRNAGTTIVRSRSGELVVGVRTRLPLSIGCTGPQCEEERPARLEIDRDGSWIVLSEGT